LYLSHLRDQLNGQISNGVSYVVPSIRSSK
jgi:hypothetical protein